MDSNWKKLQHLSQIDSIKKESEQQPVMIFKHSTRCSISAMAWDRLKRNWKTEDSARVSPYYLDLITYREISNAIVMVFDVYHESRLVVIIMGEKAHYNNSN